MHASHTGVAHLSKYLRGMHVSALTPSSTALRLRTCMKDLHAACKVCGSLKLSVRSVYRTLLCKVKPVAYFCGTCHVSPGLTIASTYAYVDHCCGVKHNHHRHSAKRCTHIGKLPTSMKTWEALSLTQALNLNTSTEPHHSMPVPHSSGARPTDIHHYSRATRALLVIC